MKRPIRFLSALLLALFTAGAAHAVPLSTLLGGGSIIAGDKLFDSWSVISYSASDIDDVGRTFNAANIEVTALNDGGMDPGPGLLFTVTNGELRVIGDDIYAFVDLMFGFRASVLTPGLLIKDNSLAYAPAGAYWSVQVDDSYDVGSYVLETMGTTEGASDLGTEIIEFSRLFNKTSDLTISQVSDSATFAPQAEIWITKNILVWAVDATDSAGLFSFEQRFSQTTVPEPATLALLCLGLAGLGFARRRQ